MPLYIGNKKVCPIVPTWRGFWSVTIQGFPGTIVDCGIQKTIGDDSKAIFKFAEAGTYTFIAMRGTETKVLEVELIEGEYFMQRDMYIGIKFLEYVNTNSGAMINTGIIPATNDIYIRIKHRIINPVTAVSGLWGYMHVSTVPRFGLYLNGENYGTGINNTLGTSLRYSSNIVDAVYENGRLSFDGFLYIDEGKKDTDNTYIPIYFGARGNQTGEAQWPIDMDIYEFDITYGNITKTYRPCQTDGGTVGFWDTTNNEFISSCTDKEFLPGPMIL